MKYKFLFLISSVFLIFFLNNISAVVIYGDWKDGSQNAHINAGESIDFNADFFSMSFPMTINVKLYDSTNHLVYSFENNKVIGSYGYNNTYSLTQAIYKTTGNFNVILSGSDSFPSSDSHTLTLVINQPPTNHLPVITSNPVTKVDEKKNYIYQVTATDADSDTLFYSLTQAPNWLSINSQTGLVSGTAPSVNADTEFNIAVQVSDGKGGVVAQTYILIVKDVPISPNNPPVAKNQSITINKDTSVSIILIATDSDGNALTFSIVGNPLYGTLSNFNPSTGQVTYKPNTNFVGADSFTFKANDGIANSNTATVSIAVNPVVTNNPPVITSNPVTKVDEKKNYIYQVTATDADSDTLVYSLTQAPNWLSINSQTGLVSGTAPSVNTDTNFDVTVRVSDGKANVTQSYVLTVKNVVGSGGNGGGSGSSGTRIIPDQTFETQRYLEQFAPKAIALNEEKPKVENKNSLGILPILFGLLSIVLIIILLVLLILRSR